MSAPPRGTQTPIGTADAGRATWRTYAPWLFHLITVVVGLGVVFTVDFFDGLLRTLAALTLLPAWLLYAVVQAVAIARRRQRLRAAAHLLVLPAVAWLALGPLNVGWELNRPAFERMVASIPPTDGAHKCDRIPIPSRLGTWRTLKFALRIDGAVFVPVSVGLYGTGVAYSPALPPEAAGVGSCGGGFLGSRFTPLGGGWYSWSFRD